MNQVISKPVTLEALEVLRKVVKNLNFEIEDEKEVPAQLNW
jgi:hypothetical protein